MKRQSGFAHLAALFVTLLLATIATSFVVETRSASRAARAELDLSLVRQAADAGVRRAIFDLTQRLSDAEQDFSNANARRDWRFGEATLDILITPESSKTDLNVASLSALQQLFLQVGTGENVALDLAQRVDLYRRQSRFVDEDAAEGIVLGMSTELDARPFMHLEDLVNISGVTHDMMSNLSAHATVFGQSFTDQQTQRARSDKAASFHIRAQASLGDEAVFVREAIVSVSARTPTRYAIRRWTQGNVTALERLALE